MKQKPCSEAGCGVLVPLRTGYCDKHQKNSGWQRRTPEQVKAHTAMYGHEWRKARHSAYQRDKYLCQVCASNGRLRTATSVDHIVPTSQGGTHDLSNLQAICGDCHRIKTQRESAAGGKG